MILPSYTGIIISQYKDPYEPIRIPWKIIRVWEVGQIAMLMLGCSMVDFFLSILILFIDRQAGDHLNKLMDDEYAP